jgi:aspartate kinase
MKVFKFGGASLKNAQAIRNMVSIVKAHQEAPLLIVVSAMGKTTNALEDVLRIFHSGGDFQQALQAIKAYHVAICTDLFTSSDSVVAKIDQIFDALHTQFGAGQDPDQRYDQVVSTGELLSSVIVAQCLSESGVPCEWADARKYIVTNHAYREGKVDWRKTAERILSLKHVLEEKNILTQGFIGGTEDGKFTTTLGREGSDFTAAIFGSCLNADSVTIWKDVPGVMSADPKRISTAIVFDELPYKEAAEMTYYGASVIHPKTIKPLALKLIPLFVKSFDNPALRGTKIHECHIDDLPPLIVFKENQCLISCKVTDYTFLNEQQVGTIFHALSALGIKINVMQNSAISFSFCVDFRENKILQLIHTLQQHFEVYYNTGLTLITVKNYDDDTFNAYRKKPGILIAQSSRSTLQVLLKHGDALAQCVV